MKTFSAAVVGFFNVNNAGDERLRHAWVRLLPEAQLTFYNMNGLRKTDLWKQDWIFMGGGSILHDANPLVIGGGKTVLSAHHRVGVAGVSVSGLLRPEQVPDVHALMARSEFFYVRDKRTRDILGKDATLAPDLSWVCPVDGHAIAPTRDVAMIFAPCPWQPAFKMSDWVSAFSAFSTTYIPMYFPRDVALIEDEGLSAPEEFDLLHLTTARVVVSSRFHGLMFGLQVGKPIVAVNYDDKVGAFMKENGLGEFCFEVSEAAEAAACARSMIANPNATAAIFERARSRLIAAGEDLRDQIRKTVETARTLKPSLRQRILHKIFDALT